MRFMRRQKSLDSTLRNMMPTIVLSTSDCQIKYTITSPRLSKIPFQLVYLLPNLQGHW